MDGSDEVNKRGEYYEFAKLTGTFVYGYPVATTSLEADPDVNQKQFISKSSVAFTNSSIIINATTSKANAQTIYGDKSDPIIVTVKFPQLTNTVSDTLAKGLKVGERVKS